MNVTDELAAKFLALSRMKGQNIPVPPAKYLLVEDNEFDAEIAMQIIQATGAVVTWAKTGEEAIRLLDVSKDASIPNYQIIYLDLALRPGPSGIDVLEHVNKQFPELPVVIITGSLSDQAIQEALKSHRYVLLIEKPLSAEDVERIRKSHNI